MRPEGGFDGEDPTRDSEGRGRDLRSRGAAAPGSTPTPEKKPEGLAKLARERYGRFLTSDGSR
jgi:hypothetical protein